MKFLQTSRSRKISLPLFVGATLSLIALGSTAAHATAGPNRVPAGTYVDESFDPTAPSVVIGESGGLGRSGCPDRNYVALGYVWSNSVNGCNVIGTNSKVKVGYGWATDGRGSAVINAKGFNSARKTTWYAAGRGTGRTIQINWGNVAASKQIQGISTGALATKIKFS